MANVTIKAEVTDAALTIFEMQNRRGYIVPKFNFHYEERCSGSIGLSPVEVTKPMFCDPAT